MASLFNQTRNRPATPYETGQMSSLSPHSQFGMDGQFGRYGSLQNVTSLLQGKDLKNPKTFARLMGPGLAQEFGFFNQTAGDRLGALSNAFASLDPSNRFGLASSFQSAEAGRAEEIARRNKGILRSRFGSQPSLEAGAELAAQNAAQSSTGQYMRQLSDPRSLAANYLSQAEAYGAGNVFQGLPLAMQAFGIAGQMPRTPTFWDTAANIGGTVAGFGGFG